MVARATARLVRACRFPLSVSRSPPPVLSSIAPNPSFLAAAAPAASAQIPPQFIRWLSRSFRQTVFAKNIMEYHNIL
jgi:hypothetical protein